MDMVHVLLFKLESIHCTEKSKIKIIDQQDRIILTHFTYSHQ